MEVIWMLLFFMVGLFFGSFFCVVGMRVGRKEDFVRGRSHCDQCLHPLSFCDLIPLFSFLFLKGRCRYCQKKLNPLLFWVELFTGILFVISYYSFGLSIDCLIALFLVSLTMIVLTSDLLYLMISDMVLLFFSFIFLILTFLKGGFLGLFQSFFSGVFLFFFMYLFMELGRFLFKKECLGGGDVKLLFVIGLLLDPFLGVFTIFIGSFCALPVAFFLQQKKKEAAIPFGPFLLLAALFLFFSKVTSFDIVSFLTNILANPFL